MISFKKNLCDYYKVWFLLIMSTVLVACAGTGSREFSTIQPLLDDQSTTVVAVLRHIGYANSGVLMDIRLDRKSIANLGDQEMVAYPIEPGMHILEAEFSGLVAAAFAGEQSINFEIEEGEKKYFVVQMRGGLVSNTVTLLEVTRSGFSSML